MNARLPARNHRSLHLAHRWLIVSFGIALGLLAACARPAADLHREGPPAAVSHGTDDPSSLERTS